MSDLSPSRIAELRKLAEAATKGPVAWFGQGPHEVYLATTHSGRRFVMGFKRKGTQRAEPTFQVKGRMVPSTELLQFEVGNRGVVGMTAAKADESVYRYDVSAIAHPDARLIAEAFTAIPELLADNERLSARVKEAAGLLRDVGSSSDVDGANFHLHAPINGEATWHARRDAFLAHEAKQ